MFLVYLNFSPLDCTGKEGTQQRNRGVDQAQGGVAVTETSARMARLAKMAGGGQTPFSLPSLNALQKQHGGGGGGRARRREED